MYRIDSFDSNVESWDAYSERLGQYFICNEIADEKKVPALLRLTGSKTYSLLRDLTAPDLPATKTFDQLAEILKGNFSPQAVVYCTTVLVFKARST